MYTLRSTLPTDSLGTGCATTTLPPSTVSPVYSVSIPSDANSAFFLEAEISFVEQLGGITCAAGGVDINATVFDSSFSTFATNTQTASSTLAILSQSTSSTLAPSVQTQPSAVSPVSGLTVGAKVGIGIGVAVGVILLLLLGWFIGRKG